MSDDQEARIKALEDELAARKKADAEKRDRDQNSKAFIVALVVLAIAVGAWWLSTRQEEPPPPAPVFVPPAVVAPSESPTFSPSPPTAPLTETLCRGLAGDWVWVPDPDAYPYGGTCIDADP
jgi:hypothetical protein